MDQERMYIQAETRDSRSAVQHKRTAKTCAAFDFFRTAAIILLAGILLVSMATAETFDFSDLDDSVLPDGILRIYRLSFSAEDTVIDIRLFPEENCREAAEAMAERYGSLELVDGQGSTLAVATADNGQPEVRTDDWEAERWACCYTVRAAGMDSVPESIGIMTRQGEILWVQTDQPQE
ncbi:MAG: hypothetical protein IKS46_01815 [Clostridia bacterium]|nr:hypothetical protein [Clostridia bacterium]